MPLLRRHRRSLLPRLCAAAVWSNSYIGTGPTLIPVCCCNPVRREPVQLLQLHRACLLLLQPYAQSGPNMQPSTHRKNEEEVRVMLSALRADKFSALILDAPVLEYVTGTNEASTTAVQYTCS